MPLLLAKWEYLAGLLALLAIVGSIFGCGAHWQAGRDATKAAKVATIQAQRDAIAAATYAKAVQDRDAAEKAATEANRRIYADLEPKLAAATADGRRLARLLHDALSRPANRGTGQAAPDQPGTAPAVGESGSTGKIAGPIERGLGDYIASCTRDEARFSALKEEVRGQLAP